MMKIRLIGTDEYQVSAWSGGKTVQLAIGPENALYADRSFLWRISSATVELAESDYTSLPDYDRWITPLEGEMKLSHNGGEYREVVVLEPYAFDGADATHCIGVCTDFNLMLRKGCCEGGISGIRMSTGEEKTIVLESDVLLVYCFKGQAVISAEDKTVTATEKSSLLLEDAYGKEISVHSEQPSVLVLASVRVPETGKVF